MTPGQRGEAGGEGAGALWSPGFHRPVVWPRASHCPSGLQCPPRKQGHLSRCPVSSFWFGHSTMPVSFLRFLSSFSLLLRESMVWPGVAENHLLLLWARQETRNLISSFLLIPMLARLSWSKWRSLHYRTRPQGKSHIANYRLPCLVFSPYYHGI